jgi:hypothetical protein
MALDYIKWLNSLREVASGLKLRHIKAQLQIGKPYSPEEMREEEEYLAQGMGKPGFRYHKSLRALYLAARSISFDWQTRGSSQMSPMSGGMKLSPLVLLYEDDPEMNSSDPHQRKWRPLDEWSKVTQTVIRFDDDFAKPTLGFRSVEGGESIRQLDLSIDEYFEISLAACCLNEWQLLFVTDGSLRNTENAEGFFASLTDLTPPANPTLVRERLKRF